MSRAYQEYKAAPDKWLGDVPAHWALERIKYGLSEKKSKKNPELTPGAISFGRVISKDAEKILPETRETYQEVLAGEYLINPINLNYDLISLRTALSELDVCVSPAYIVLNAIPEKVVPAYGNYVLHVFDVRHMKTLGAGVRQTITFKDIGQCVWALPPQDEQTAIANFLDRETTQIDGLIEKKGRFIALLKEKRAAVITHAVTKGFEKNVEMKPSGEAWIGDIPAHWELERIKYGLTEKKSKKNPELTPGAISYGRVISKDAERILPETRETYQEVLAGEYLINPINLNYDLISLRTALSELDVCVSPAYIVLNALPEKVVPAFGNYVLHVFDVRHMKTLGAGVRQTITFKDIGQCLWALPPQDEQTAIANFLDRETARIDGLIARTAHSIDLLKEKRSALITAAVTGKIDVRNAA